ncbi:MAG TPA: SIS domain-containing protein [Acidimicrobiales bacterium]|nr:SIS domain-containing protein [Acidimicrobiales bacterium]
MNLPPYLDTLGIWTATIGLPEQIRGAVDSACERLDVSAPLDGGTFDSVVVFGSGGSGTAARLAAAYGDDHATVPVHAVDDGVVPGFVGPHTLAVAASFPGESEETTIAIMDARARGAQAVVVGGDGALRDWAVSDGITSFAIPDSLPVSRTALGALTVPILLTMSRAGLTPDVMPSLAAACEGLGRRRDVLMAPEGMAEVVARRIGRTIPLVYGSRGICAVAARRWKTQINENAKTPAFFAVAPELSHNEVAGWGQHGDVTRQVFSLVALRQNGERPEVARRFDMVLAATDEVMADVITVRAEGDDDLGRFFDFALFGDLVSLHLAGREGTDPGPVPAVDDASAGVP